MKEKKTCLSLKQDRSQSEKVKIEQKNYTEMKCEEQT